MKTAGFDVKVEDRDVLESWLRSNTIPQALGTRARLVLQSTQGSSLRGIPQQLGMTECTVCLWRRRYQKEGVSGLRSRRHSGRPGSITRAKRICGGDGDLCVGLRPPPIGARGGWPIR